MSTRSFRGSWTVVLLVAVAIAAQANTVHVPTDYATIQVALNVSAVGDTVMVEPGTYSDYTIVNGDATVAVIPDGVVLRSTAGPEQTIIDMSPLDGIGQVAFSVGGHMSGLTVIEGFRVTGGRPNTTMIAVGGTSYAEIRNCILEGADVPDPQARRKGVGAANSLIRVIDCSFVRCSSSTGAGINMTNGSLIAESCEFIECTNQAIRVAKDLPGGPYSLEVRDCLLDHIVTVPSSGGTGGGCILGRDLDGPMTVDGCTFISPTLGGVGSEGAAVAFGGVGAKTITNNVFQDITLTDYNASCIRIVHSAPVVSGNTFWNIHQNPDAVWAGTILWGSQLTGAVFENNIVSEVSGTPALILSTPSLTVGCNVFWSVAEGPGYELDPTDRIADPQLCDPESGDFTLQATSPCLPGLSLGCGQIGALGEGCGTVNLTPQSWGRIKSTFRTAEE